MPSASIDHLVITAPSLDAGKKMLYEALGVWPQAGGEHARMGTHNLLLRLGAKLYLEVIAINPASPAPDRPRWFELDGKAQNRSPVLSTWVARCDDIHLARATFSSSHGDIEPMSRGDLSWSITIAQDGSLPFDGVAPTLIQWQTPDHPARRLENRGCSLIRLNGYHPDAARINDMLMNIGFGGEFFAVPGHHPHLVAQIQTPHGMRELTGLAVQGPCG
jgi:Glyoxalase-like domain